MWAKGPVARWEFAAYGALLATAAVMRLWDLGARAMHHDESLHAYYSWNLARGEGYEHLPMMHGPFQFEANAAVFYVLGDSDVSARLLYAVFGSLLVVLPLLLRSRLGRPGALTVAVMLAFSPALLYFSRFARNDILMAVWTLGLVISMWRYLDEGRPRYLYAAAALLAVAFATKETAYLVTALLGLYLVLRVAYERWAAAASGPGTGEAAPARGLITRVWASLQIFSGTSSRPLSFLVLLITLSLPQWSAMIGLFQDTPLLSWSNLVLAAPVTEVAIGAPQGGGLVIAFLLVVGLLGVSVRWGGRWNWSVWWRSAVIFYAIWVLLYTTFFTNIGGLGSGMWQSLGYWVVQQGEGRGAQPWYYYFVISSVYEFLPLLLGLAATVFYLRRRDQFGLFLVFWALGTFFLYTLASEKMPWLLVNITLPIVVLSGRFVGKVLGRVRWRRLISSGGFLLAGVVPVLLVSAWRLALFDEGASDGSDTLILLALGGAVTASLVAGAFLVRRAGVRSGLAFVLVPVGLVLLALTLRSGWLASYRNGDVPIEMIVYTQTSPDVLQRFQEIQEAADATGGPLELPISVDSTSGFTWPWAWYLRDYTRVEFPTYEGRSLDQSESIVLVVHSRNAGAADEALGDLYTEGEVVKHRWWFPESTYRDLTIGKFLSGLVDRQTWRRATDYFLNRDGVEDLVGSEDSYIYFANDLGDQSPAP